jgi:alpha-beta hydrolase superfamily lysophospholipase
MLSGKLPTNRLFELPWGNDPLSRMKLSPNELIQFQSFMNQNHESAHQITDKPVLIVQGVLDKLVRPEGTVELFNELNTKDKKIVLIPDGEHLIFEENQFTDEVGEPTGQLGGSTLG